MDYKKKIEHRSWANFKILEQLESFFIRYPDQRFGQALINLNLVPEGDIWNEESVDILNTLNKTIKTRLEKGTDSSRKLILVFIIEIYVL